MDTATEYRIKLRRDIAKVKPEAEPVDGKVFRFLEGWVMDETDTSIYVGEMAMIPFDKSYPVSAPAWIASGDLQPTGRKD